MLKTLFVGLWACLVTLGATYAGVQWRARGAAPEPQHVEKASVHKVKAITVPIIANGTLKGYVSAEFSFVGAEAGGHESAGPEPESFFMDEAFRLIYSDTQVDFAHLEKKDLAALTEQITANVNRRIGRSIIKETLLRNFAFVAREDMPR